MSLGGVVGVFQHVLDGFSSNERYRLLAIAPWNSGLCVKVAAGPGDAVVALGRVWRSPQVLRVPEVSATASILPSPVCDDFFLFWFRKYRTRRREHCHHQTKCLHAGCRTREVRPYSKKRKHARSTKN